MKAITKFVAASAAAAALMAGASSADAAVWLGLQHNGGGIVTVDVDASLVSFDGAFGSFEANVAFGADGVFPQLLASTLGTQNSTGGNAGTLDVYITVDNLTDVPDGFFSSFAVNVLPASWTLQLRTYANANNALWGIGGAVLADQTFNGISTHVATLSPDVGPGPYSVTARYTVTAPTNGGSLSTAAIAAVPEPGTWALMIMGFGGAGAMLRNRRRGLAAA